MRYSQLFGKTRREVPNEARIVSHRLLLQGGFIHQTAAGIYSFLPLGLRVLQKIDAIIREEFTQRGIQHLFMPFVHPASLWEESGRRQKMAKILATFEAAHGGEYLLAPTHEETVTDLARSFIKSYRDLPVILNQNQWKYRDEVRVSGGLLRTREFLMQDAYSFDRDAAGLDRSFRTVSEAYHAVFERIGLPVSVVQADSGTMGGTDSEEFMAIADVGEDRIFRCDHCSYRANAEKAVSRVTAHPQDCEQKPMQAVEGKGLIGVEPLAKFLGIPVHQTTKTLLFQADKQVVAVMIRGDYNVSEVKLANHLRCTSLALATPEVVKRVTGAEVGYAGPVGLPKEVQLVADLTCADRVNFEAGANRTHFHNINVNFERDFPMPPFTDLRAVKAGDGCPQCEGKLAEARAIELGHVFKLGTCYAESMGALFVDEDGKKKPVIMGCYGIGISRVMAAAVEVSHDDAGIIWPLGIAPFQAHLILLGKGEDIRKEAETLYAELSAQGIETLFDDREEATAGEKFADADLIGMPHRLVMSERSLKEGGIEWKRRSEKQSKVVPRKALREVFA